MIPHLHPLNDFLGVLSAMVCKTREKREERREKLLAQLKNICVSQYGQYYDPCKYSDRKNTILPQIYADEAPGARDGRSGSISTGTLSVFFSMLLPNKVGEYMILAASVKILPTRYQKHAHPAPNFCALRDCLSSLSMLPFFS